MSYETLRQLADSIGLVFLCLVFFAALWRALRPGAREAQRAASLIPFDDERPRNG
ncbi:MAG: cbb3-type cytochrome c oxidase subunit 3 [Sphingomonas sp.]|nr:cbb3-type cytochrome c oxidase subunit 3 [Sphingomonas sp.]